MLERLCPLVVSLMIARGPILLRYAANGIRPTELWLEETNLLVKYRLAGEADQRAEGQTSHS